MFKSNKDTITRQKFSFLAQKEINLCLIDYFFFFLSQHFLAIRLLESLFVLFYMAPKVYIKLFLYLLGQHTDKHHASRRYTSSVLVYILVVEDYSVMVLVSGTTAANGIYIQVLGLQW